MPLSEEDQAALKLAQEQALVRRSQDAQVPVLLRLARDMSKEDLDTALIIESAARFIVVTNANKQN